MKTLPDIRFVPRKEIDIPRWDRCIEQAPNGLIYAFSNYLDHMAVNWDGLVLGDYEAVMPLTWNKKFGVSYLYQPFLAAQLGMFGKTVNETSLECFLDKIPGRFRYWDIYLNHGNVFPVRKYGLYQRVNFILPLQSDYSVLVDNYRENIRRNIRRAREGGCTGDKDFDVEFVIALAVEQMRTYTREAAINTERFRKLYGDLRAKDQAVTYGIRSASGELIASCVFLFSHHRAYYILVGNHPDGRTIGASHALIDLFIKDHAGQNLTLDFEGSDIRNLAFFYSSFGARQENYAAVKLNRLPFYLKWLKK
jgi:hypothetical protein